MVALAANPPFYLARGHRYGFLENSGIGASVLQVQHRTIPGPPWPITLPQGSAIELRGDDILWAALVSGAIDYGQDVTWRLPSSSGGAAPSVVNGGTGEPAVTPNVSGSFQMAGLGGAGVITNPLTITPKKSGKLRVVVGLVWNTTITETLEAYLVYGTGAAPALHAAAVGTQFGGTAVSTLLASANNATITLDITIALTVGTTYWFDAALFVQTNHADDAVQIVDASVEEMP